VNKPVDRLKLKTTTDRNRIKASKAKMREMQEEKEKRKFMKDAERLDNLIKQNVNEGRMMKNRIE